VCSREAGSGKREAINETALSFLSAVLFLRAAGLATARTAFTVAARAIAMIHHSRDLLAIDIRTVDSSRNAVN
jgi:hypothetical protein